MLLLLWFFLCRPIEHTFKYTWQDYWSNEILGERPKITVIMHDYKRSVMPEWQVTKAHLKNENIRSWWNAVWLFSIFFDWIFFDWINFYLRQRLLCVRQWSYGVKWVLMPIMVLLCLCYLRERKKEREKKI